MRALDLDFAPRRSRWPAWVLLALGIGINADAGWRWMQLDEARAQWHERRASLMRRAPPAPPPPDERTHRELVAARHVLQELALPWDVLLRDIEGAIGEHTALLSIEPDASRRQLRIGGEARGYGDALGFMQRLNTTHALTGVHLLNHQVRDDAPERPVQFTLSAAWRTQP